MKKVINFMLFVMLSLLLLSTVSANVNADVGPKPFVIVKISGMGDKNYTATLISKEAYGPNFFYEDYQRNDDPWMEYNPIMEYEDNEGYKWIGKHWEMHGDGELDWSYYPPDNFKLLILTEDNQYYTTQVLERYAFGSYFKVDVTEAINGELEAVKIINDVETDYNYVKEILSFFIRLLLTIAIEMGLALIFGFRNKQQIITILIVNVITQVLLNVTLNVVSYYNGPLMGMGLYILGELFVLVAESTFYGCYFKTHRARAVLYAVLANLISFGAGFGLYLLEQIIYQ